MKRLFNQLPQNFGKQFMAMRYLLLGLAEHRPSYAKALRSLETAYTDVSVFARSPGVPMHYQVQLDEGFRLISTRAASEDVSDELAKVLFRDPNRWPWPLGTGTGPECVEAYERTVEVEPFSGVFTTFDKLYLSMLAFLTGLIVHEPKYQVALDALLYAKDVHVGFRKNGKTPEFQHQLEIAHYLRTMLRNMLYPAETLATIFLHDTPEDYDVSRAELQARFGERVAEAAMLLNKYDEQGNLKPAEEYYPALGLNAITSLAKPGDNGQNQSTMDIWTFKKIYAYTNNIREKSWAMMKVARRLFPEQEAIYENLKFLLRIQYNAAQAMLAAVQFDPKTGEAHPALQD